MKITIPFTDLHGEALKLKSMIVPQGGIMQILKSPKELLIGKVLDGLSFEGLSSDTLRVSLNIAKIDLKVESVKQNDIILSYSDAKALDKILEMVHAKIDDYVEFIGDCKLKVLLGSNPKMASVFEWVTLQAITFDPSNIFIDVAPAQ